MEKTNYIAKRCTMTGTHAPEHGDTPLAPADRFLEKRRRSGASKPGHQPERTDMRLFTALPAISIHLFHAGGREASRGAFIAAPCRA